MDPASAGCGRTWMSAIHRAGTTGGWPLGDGDTGSAPDFEASSPDEVQAESRIAIATHDAAFELANFLTAWESDYGVLPAGLDVSLGTLVPQGQRSPAIRRSAVPAACADGCLFEVYST